MILLINTKIKIILSIKALIYNVFTNFLCKYIYQIVVFFKIILIDTEARVSVFTHPEAKEHLEHHEFSLVNPGTNTCVFIGQSM